MDITKPVYVGFFLSQMSRKYLLKMVPPKHKQIFGGHVTLAFGRHMEKPEYYPLGELAALEITGEYFDERGQCVILNPESISKWLAPTQTPHITISCVEGVRPIYSNELIKSKTDLLTVSMWKKPMVLVGVLDFFPRSADIDREVA